MVKFLTQMLLIYVQQNLHELQWTSVHKNEWQQTVHHNKPQIIIPQVKTSN